MSIAFIEQSESTGLGFNPRYKEYYTDEAFRATVISPEEIVKRINGSKRDVLAAICGVKVVGTASMTLKNEGNIYLQSMAVEPSYQNRGVGNHIMDRIQDIADREDCTSISLECFMPLYNAIRFYQQYGFRKTGKRRNYHGITVFEMKKQIIYCEIH